MAVAAQGLLLFLTTFLRTVPLFQNGVIGFLLLGVPGFRRPAYYCAQGRFFYPAFPRTAGGGTNHGRVG